MIFISCKKEGPVIEPSNITINNAWQLSMQSTYLAHGGDLFTNGTIQIDNSVYDGKIQYVSLNSIMVINDTIFPSVSTSYSSRVWSINENQFIIDTYYDENGFAYNISEHNFTKNLDTLVVNFQSGDIKKFVINKLTTNQFHITSIVDTNYIPLIDANGIYQDTVLIDVTSYTYYFDVIQ